MDRIIIHGLRVETHIGVPDAERAAPQQLLINVVLTPLASFDGLNDDIDRTVDYDAAAQRISALASERPRHLIETLADEIARMLITDFPAQSVEVELRKFILPQTDYVAVRCTRHR
ncbi:hypothetical protein BH09VER1_BH09VER1_42490 [soil metagenome]